MKRFQAQRKFAQGAFIPGANSNERRNDVAPVKDGEEKRSKIVMNKNSPSGLLDVVSLKSIHNHSQPIVLVERLPKKVTKDPRQTSPVAQLTTRKEPKTVKNSLVRAVTGVTDSQSQRCGMTLRSRINKKQKALKKRILVKQNIIKQITKRKSIVTSARRKSSALSGFSTDDDMPLRQSVDKTPLHDKPTKRSAIIKDREAVIPMKIKSVVAPTETAVTFGESTQQQKETEISLPSVKPKQITEKVRKSATEMATDETLTNQTMLEDFHLRYDDCEEKEQHVQTPTFYGPSEIEKWIGSGPSHPLPPEEVPTDAPPLQKVPLASTPPQKPATEKQNNFKIPVSPKKFSLRSKQNKSRSPQLNSNKGSCEKLPTVKASPQKRSMDSRAQAGEKVVTPAKKLKLKRSIPGDSRPDKSPSPRDKNTSPGDQNTSPGNKRSSSGRKCPSSSVESTTSGVNNHVSVDEHQMTNKKGPTKGVTEVNGFPSSGENDSSYSKSNINEQARIRLQNRAPSPCPSSKYTSVMSIASARQQDLISRCNHCPQCHKISKYIELQKAHFRLENTQSSGIQHNDVYTFSDTDLTSKEPPILGFRKNRRKDSTSENNLYLDLLPTSSHIVQLVSVKIPNQDKTIMKAKLVPKSEVNKADLTKNNEEVVTLMEQENFLEELLNSLNAKAPTSNVDVQTPSTSAVPSSSNKDTTAVGKVVDAPTFYPTAAEFENPSAYLEKITPAASKFGLCKIVPPKDFKPPCNINQLTNFSAMNQYPGKMFCRWGSATRDYCAIKASTNVSFKNPPLINNVEVNVPKLYHIVQKMGGLTEVIKKDKWKQVADEMNYQKGPQVVRKLDQVYVKYLLPYDTLTSRERQEALNKVEKAWTKRYKRMLFRAQNPLLKQKQVLGEASSDEDDDDEGTNRALDKADDCIVQGRNMNLNIFEKVARTVMKMFFGNLDRDPTPEEVEDEYWRLVVLGNEHVCIYTAAVDTGNEGHGFPKKANIYSKHPWNLKVLSNSPGSVLRSLGSVLSVTVPTLHLGMVFSTSCWHRDPHGLPWIEYLHQGASKIWYGIPDKQSDQFRKAVEVLCPAYCQNKSIWLPSDITMIPPNLLKDHNVTLSRTVQKPGEYIIIFPKAYSCSVATGYTVSESVYYAPFSWLATIQNDFQDVRDSFEPTMFPLDQLLIAMAQDPRVPSSALPVVHRTLDTIVRDELLNRAQLRTRNVTFKFTSHPALKKCRVWNVRELPECDVCRATLYISKVTSLFDKKEGVYYCLQHALRILETPAHSDRDFSGATVIAYLTEEQLEGVIAKLRKRLFPVA